MQTHFVQTMAIQLAAKLLRNENVKRYINYACCGTLEENREMKTENIRQTEGIDDMIDKAEAFRFGQVCAKAIDHHLKQCDKQQLKYYEAAIASEFFGINPGSDEEIEEKVILLINAFTKRAQIQTHTTKPGYEDIDKWLDSFYQIQSEYGEFVDQFAQLTIDASKEQKIKSFFNREDSIIHLALSDESLDTGMLQKTCNEMPKTIFGKILRDICKAEM